MNLKDIRIKVIRDHRVALVISLALVHSQGIILRLKTSQLFLILSHQLLQLLHFLISSIVILLPFMLDGHSPFQNPILFHNPFNFLLHRNLFLVKNLCCIGSDTGTGH